MIGIAALLAVPALASTPWAIYSARRNARRTQRAEERSVPLHDAWYDTTTTRSQGEPGASVPALQAGGRLRPRPARGHGRARAARSA